MAQHFSIITNEPFRYKGSYHVRQDAILGRIVGRTTPIEGGTLLSQNPATGKWYPLAESAATSASLACGTLGLLVAVQQVEEDAWDEIDDGEFAITVDGVLRNVTGLNFSSVTSLADVAAVIDGAGASHGFSCKYAHNKVVFRSLKSGKYLSSITALSAVAAGAGTDISGAGHLNGLAAGTGVVVTAATGQTADGILLDSSITAAAIDAADVTACTVIVRGNGLILNTADITLENSLTLASVLGLEGKTIARSLREIDIQFGTGVSLDSVLSLE